MPRRFFIYPNYNDIYREILPGRNYYGEEQGGEIVTQDEFSTIIWKIRGGIV